MAYLVSAKEPDQMRLFLVVGFLGGYTTFSSFSFDTIGLISRGAIFEAFGYIFSTLCFSFLGTWVGMMVVRLFITGSK